MLVRFLCIVVEQHKWDKATFERKQAAAFFVSVCVSVRVIFWCYVSVFWRGMHIAATAASKRESP